MNAADGTEQDLCVQCGLCCGGSLFDQAKLTPEEAPRMRALGFAVEMQGEQALFKLPCGFQNGPVCTVYADRPQTCRAYRCETLLALDAGRIGRAEADRRTTEVKAAIAQLRTHMLPGESFQQLRERFGTDPSPSSALGLAMLVHDLVLDRYIRKPHQRALDPAPEITLVPSRPRARTPANAARPRAA